MEGLVSVQPIRDCAHCRDEFILKKEEFKDLSVAQKCGNCDNVGENWVCLQCKEVSCSRYVKSH